MAGTFKVGDHVKWAYGAGTATGTIRKVHTDDFEHNDRTHHATKDEPQYEIESDATGNPVAHKADALTLD